MDFHDLPPRRDPKGGSPRTPSTPIRVGDYQEYVAAQVPNGNGTVWKVAASGFAGLFISMTIAWWTATTGKGVSRMEMEDYAQRYSPYSQDQKLLAEHNSQQDKEIGILRGQADRIFDRIQMIDQAHITYDSKLADLYKKLDTITNYLEEEKKVKR